MTARYDTDHHHRCSIRLKGYDYAQPGAYFITVVTQDRQCIFGDVVNDDMRMNDAGRIARDCWMAIPDHFDTCELDAFVVMPNHVHGIIVIGGATLGTDIVGATHASPLPNRSRPTGPGPHSVGAIVGSFKSAATRSINRLRTTPGAAVWQRNYYEHIIRNTESLNRVWEYIAANPACWAEDVENPENVGQRM